MEAIFCVLVKFTCSVGRRDRRGVERGLARCIPLMRTAPFVLVRYTCVRRSLCVGEVYVCARARQDGLLRCPFLSTSTLVSSLVLGGFVLS